MSLSPGLEGSAARTVSEGDLATAVRSGDVPVLGTPVVVALCEEATVDAVAGALEAGQTTVGVRVEIDHLAPSVVGAAIIARAVLDTIDGRGLRFSVEAHDGEALIARGAVHRVVVDRDRFISRLG